MVKKKTINKWPLVEITDSKLVIYPDEIIQLFRNTNIIPNCNSWSPRMKSVCVEYNRRKKPYLYLIISVDTKDLIDRIVEAILCPNENFYYDEATDTCLCKIGIFDASPTACLNAGKTYKNILLHSHFDSVKFKNIGSHTHSTYTVKTWLMWPSKGTLIYGHIRQVVP